MAYESAIPVEERGDYLAAYKKRLTGELGPEGDEIPDFFYTVHCFHVL
jgi:hypothetical protein